MPVAIVASKQYFSLIHAARTFYSCSQRGAGSAVNTPKNAVFYTGVARALLAHTTVRFPQILCARLSRATVWCLEDDVVSVKRHSRWSGLKVPPAVVRRQHAVDHVTERLNVSSACVLSTRIALVNASEVHVTSRRFAYLCSKRLRMWKPVSSTLATSYPTPDKCKAASGIAI